MSTIGDNIKRRREELGITQEELAKKLGYKSRTAIAKIESGVNDINQTKVVSFANALDVPPSFIMGWGNESNMVSEKVTKYNVNHMLMDLDSMLKNNQRFMLKCISNIIKHERIKKDLTERAVSDKSGIPLFEYLRFESDSENIGARRIIDITNALNMDFYYFIGSLVGCQAAMKALDSINITDQEKENVQNELAKSIIYRK